MYRIRIKKAPVGWLNNNNVWNEGAMQSPLPKAQKGGVLEHYKKQLLKDDGKYLVTDKGTNRTYYGYPGPDGKLIENSFEVLTGKAGNNNYVNPYGLDEMEKMNEIAMNKAKVTPVGTFPLTYSPDIYGNPGLSLGNTAGVAMHVTYDPKTRDAYYNNNIRADNYASYGCINCRKPDIDNVLKGFGNKDRINIIDSRRSLAENKELAQDNQYLFNNPEAARMLFERPGSKIVKRKWNAQKKLYEGDESYFDPNTETIISKKDLAPVIVYAHKKKIMQGDMASGKPEILTPLQQQLATSNRPQVNVSIVDYLNARGIDSGKENRLQMAHDLGMDDYAYRADDNIKMLRRLEQMEAMAKSTQPDGAVQMKAGGNVAVDGAQQYNVRESLGPIDRGNANIEAERGETISGDFDSDGINEHFTVGGKRHAEGGTPLNVPEGSFVFADTKKLKIGGPALQQFGKSGNDKNKYTPATLAKQYNTNKYKAILRDRTSDRVALETAKLMLENNEAKLGKLALMQEAMKGFPSGIPSIAMPYVQQFLGVSADAAAPQQVPAMPQQAPAMQQQAPAMQQQEPMMLQQAPMMQKGGQKGRPVYSPEMVQNSFTGVDNQVTTFPSYMIKDGKPVFATQVPLVQSKRNDGTFGTLTMDMQDFFKRHPWVKQGNPAFNPSSKQDVKWFQNEYNKRYDSLLGRKYFDGTGHRKVDGLFGQGTFSTPAIEFTQPEEEITRVFPEPEKYIDEYDYYPVKEKEVIVQEKVPPQKEKVNDKKVPKEKMPLWTQDVLNTGAAFGNRFGLQKYMPTYVSPGAVIPNPTFYDPTRQLAANQEQAAAQNMMNTMFAGPQRQRAVGSNIQGQAAGNAANILGQVQNQNVGVANQFAGVTSDIMNKKALQDAAARKTYMDELATVNQQYDNSKMLANNNLLANVNSTITNAQETYWLNKMNEQFAIDPRTGRLSFTKGKSLKATADQSEQNDAELYNYYNKAFRDANPNLEKLEDRAHEYAMKKIQTRQRISSNSDGDQQYSVSGMGVNPSIYNYMNLPVGGLSRKGGQ